MKKKLSRRTTKPTVTELFAGAGLWSSAFVAEGFSVTRAIEIDSIAAATYKRNLGPHIEAADVLESEPKGKCDVLLAGSPCQGFSTLGRRDSQDPRNLLSLDLLRWVPVLCPEIIAIENVEAFLYSSVYDQLRSSLELMDYRVVSIVVDATDYGVPQRRVRSFTFATKGRLPKLKPNLRNAVRTVREAWSGLPDEPNGINLHTAPIPSELALARMKLIPTGGDKRDILRLAPDLSPPSWRRPRNEITDVWGRLRWERPSNTLRTCLQNPSKGRYIHPEQHRTISLREAARLHSIDEASCSFQGVLLRARP